MKSMHTYHERMEASTRAGMDKAHTLFVDVYHDLDEETPPSTRQGERWGPASLTDCSRSWGPSRLLRRASCLTPPSLPMKGQRMPCPVWAIGTSKPLARVMRTSTRDCSRSKTSC
jgi:hypothetical protein